MTACASWRRWRADWRPPAGLNAAAFRDATGLGRKRAIQILEFFDRVGYTRRVRDNHVLRGESAYALGQAAAEPVS